MNQQQQSQCIRIDSSGKKLWFKEYKYGIKPLRYIRPLLKLKKCLARMEANLCNASSHRINISKLTHYDKTEKRARNPPIEPKLSYGGSRQSQASGTNKLMNV